LLAAATAAQAASLNISPTTFVGGQSAKGKVTLSHVAPAGGTTVTLSSSDASVVVPGTVVVPAGSAAVTFSLTSSIVLATKSPVISATAPGFSDSKTLTVVPVGVGTIYLTPDSGFGDNSGRFPFTLHVRLNTTAPAGGTVVTITSSDSHLTLPNSLTVPAGSRGADAQVFPAPFPHDTIVTFTGTANGVQMQGQASFTAPKGILALARNHVNFGGKMFGRLSLNHAAPSVPMNFAVTCDQADVVLPATIAGNTNFLVTSTGSVAETAHITLTYDNQVLHATMNVVPSVTLEASAWAKSRADNRNSGQGVGLGASGNIKWAKLATPPGFASNAVGTADGTAYYLSNNGSLYAVNGGTLKWIYAANAHTGPFLGADGTIYVEGAQNIQAVNANGLQVWRHNSKTPLTSALTVGPHGDLYVAAGSDLQAISSAGRLEWTKTFTGNLGQPVASPAGDILVSGGGLGFSSVAPDGSVTWSETAHPLAMSQPAIGVDGTIYLGFRSNNFTALNSDGSLKWTSAVSVPNSSANSAVESNGSVYVSSSQGTFAYSTAGTSLWHSSDATSNVVLGSTGLIYSGADAFNPDGSIAHTLPALAGSSQNSVGADGTEFRVRGEVSLETFSPTGVAGWAVRNSPTYFGEPGVAADGTVYIAQSGGNFFALNPTGDVKWLSNPTFGAGNPVIIQDGTIYTGSASLDPNGVTKAKVGFFGSPSLGADGTFYIALPTQFLARGLDGSTYWTLGGVTGLPAVGSDSSIFISDFHGGLHSFSMTGSQNWGVSLGVDRNGPVLGPDGTIYVMTTSGNLLAVNAANGAVKWTLPLAAAKAPLAVANDGSIAILTTDRISQVSSAGVLNWSASFRSGPFYPAAPSIAGDGTIYVPCADGVIRAYSSTGTFKWGVAVGGYDSSPAIGPDGTIYIVAAGSLIAIN